MSEYDRYAATCDLRGMEKDELGAYVKHRDYKQMKVRAEKAEADVERLKESLKQIQHDIDGAECRDDLDGIKGYIDEIIKEGDNNE